MIEERVTFAKVINNALKDDEDLKDILPMNTENDDIFHLLDDGMLLIKLMNTI